MKIKQLKRKPRIENTSRLPDGMVCPHCYHDLHSYKPEEFKCDFCQILFETISGMPDLRTHADRYLSLNQERQKARKLAAKENCHSIEELARAYYAMTADVDETRREQFVRHILDASYRGDALLKRLPEQGRILEIGCGTGGFLSAASRAGRNAIGIDIASRWLVVAQKRLQDRLHLMKHPEIYPACAERIPFANATFEIIVADSLLEHLNDPIPAIREMIRVLKPGGLIVIWSPNSQWPGPDPHVGLWIIKFLPEKTAQWYLNWRRGKIFRPICRSPRQWCDLIRHHFDKLDLSFQSADTSGWPIQDRSLRGRIARLFGQISRMPLLHFILREFGPMGEIRIVKPKNAIGPNNIRK